MHTTTYPKDWREGRRFPAWELHQHGWKQGNIAEALGVTQGAVSPWRTRASDGGVEAVRSRFSPGAPTRRAPNHRAGLPLRLARGAPAFGFIGAGWTRARVADGSTRAFGVTSHPDHVGRLLTPSGWTVQQPTKRATHRDEDAIVAWREQTWPAIKQSR
jgi:transposase